MEVESRYCSVLVLAVGENSRKQQSSTLYSTYTLELVISKNYEGQRMPMQINTKYGYYYDTLVFWTDSS